LARTSAIAVALLAFSIVTFSQKVIEPKIDATTLPTSTTSSPAYAELLLKKTELQSELEGLVLEYTDEYPRVKELRYVLSLCDRDTLRLGKVKAADAGKLTQALGKLMTRKLDLENELWRLQSNYADAHPEVKRAKRRVEIFENAIDQVLK
ncbi:MAG TPA: hypothetical protein VJV05_01605, partial [Pyrinomonadaceae bacterium]|nr:hypothetical protein [Pyrinomonadaceae bacterium]